MIVAGDFTRCEIGPRNMAENEALGLVLVHMGPAKVHWAGVVIAFDPQPMSPCLKAEKRIAMRLIERLGRDEVIEAVSKAQDGPWSERGDVSLKPDKGLGGVVGWQQRPASPRHSLSFAKVQVGDNQHPKRRPIEGARGTGDQ